MENSSLVLQILINNGCTAVWSRYTISGVSLSWSIWWCWNLDPKLIQARLGPQLISFGDFVQLFKFQRKRDYVFWSKVRHYVLKICALDNAHPVVIQPLQQQCRWVWKGKIRQSIKLPMANAEQSLTNAWLKNIHGAEVVKRFNLYMARICWLHFNKTTALAETCSWSWSIHISPWYDPSKHILKQIILQN